MVQEVQTQGNWYQTPNDIQNIGYSQRKVNDYTQVRDKISTTVTFMSNKIPQTYTEDTYASSWTYTTDSGKYYKVSGGNIYFTDSGSFLVDYIPDQEVGNINNPYTVKIYVEDKVVYQKTLYPGDKTYRQFTLRMGKMNKITASLITGNDTHYSQTVGLKFVKL